jgi:hypothetical protein
MNPEEYIFEIVITDGYSFRNLIEYLKITNSKGNLVFRDDGIYYQQTNVDNSILNEFEIRSKDLGSYRYNSDKEIFVGVNLSNLRQITKPVGRRDGIRMYMLKDDPKEYLYFLIYANKAEIRENISYIQPEHVDNIYYKIEGFTRKDCDPNLFIAAGQFTKLFTTISSLKCVNCLITAYQNGVSFQGNKVNGTSGHLERYGICGSKSASFNDGTNVDDEKVGLITIDNQKIKALTKLGNLAHNDSIKIYMENDCPLKLITNIGSYGKLTIYILDINKNKE